MELPAALVAWANGWIAGTGAPVCVRSVSLDEEGRCRVGIEARRLGVTVRAEVRCRLAHEGDRLVVSGVEVHEAPDAGRGGRVVAGVLGWLRGWLVRRLAERTRELRIEVRD